MGTSDPVMLRAIEQRRQVAAELQRLLEATQELTETIDPQ